MKIKIDKYHKIHIWAIIYEVTAVRNSTDEKTTDIEQYANKLINVALWIFSLNI